jgi:hypothetical protein
MLQLKYYCVYNYRYYSYICLKQEIDVKQTKWGIRLVIFLAAVAAVTSLLPVGIMPLQAGGNTAPAPSIIWLTESTYAISDIAVGKLLDNNSTDDIAAIDVGPHKTLKAFRGEGDGNGNPDSAWSQGVGGDAVAVGDINGDGRNEVVAGDSQGFTIKAYTNDNISLWSINTSPNDRCTDIEIGDINGDLVNDVVACVGEYIYVLDGRNNGESLDTNKWPVYQQHENFKEIAIGQLDGSGGLDIAAIGTSDMGSIFVYSGGGSLLWNSHDQGSAIEIGDVNGDGLNEVVAGVMMQPQLEIESPGEVKVFKGVNPTQTVDPDPLYYFETNYEITDLALGDLNNNLADGVEVVCIDAYLWSTLSALDIDNTGNAPDSQEMWSYEISWTPIEIGHRDIAIADIDRDYKNEVIAGGIVDSGNCLLFAFDGLDSDGDGIGDLVWEPLNTFSQITAVATGDMDGDGDQDVVVATYDGIGVGTLAHNKVVTGGGDLYFDSDPSTIEGLLPVDSSSFSLQGKPNYTFPYGFFIFTVTGVEPGHDALITVTLPDPAPVGTKWVKYDNGDWQVLDIGDDDGDNVITFTLKNADVDGLLYDPGAPAFPDRRIGVGGEVAPVNRLSLVLPWLAVVMVLVSTVFLVGWKRSRVN